MNLPAITIPIEIPDVIPLLLHPVVVHFAVVLPLVILILELINLITKRKALSVSVYILFVLLIVVFAAAYVTGVTDGKEAGPLLSDDGMTALKAHKLLGVYLFYLTLLPLALKVLSLFVNKGWSRALYSMGLVALIALTFFQAKKGGELVYAYGANVSSQLALEDRVEELEDEMDELKSSYEEQIATLQPAVSDSNETLSETEDAVVQPTLDTNSSKTEPVDVNVSNVPVKPELKSSVEQKESNTSDANISK